MAKRKKKKFKELVIGVLMGGMSEEREISLISGRAAASELRKNGHTVKMVDVDRNSVEKIKKAGIDVAFPVLHGRYGEDGIMQGILEFIGIPYTGSGVAASAIAMNKIKTKQIMKAAGIPTPKWMVMCGRDGFKKTGLKYPLVFKPEDGGSAVDVAIVKNVSQARKSFEKISSGGRAVLVEEYIKGTEITVPVLLDRTLPIIEIVPQNEFYDYDAKYTKGKSTHIIPARISEKTRYEASALALKLHRELGCRDYSRVDMMVRGGRCYVLEINTLPGMTDVSLFPEAARAAGISFYKLIITLIKEAVKRS
ncbi:MAG TPA: D-alanine--D-alanine ligase [Firmicutes bacterium]|nr:D-alanine--D-alanine ligase [Bacillota bacterium]